MKNSITSLSVVGLLIFAGLACTNSDEPKSNSLNPQTVEKKSASGNQKLDEYTIKGIRFVYFKIPAGLEKDALIASAQKLHDQEPDAQLILVDEDSKVKEYIAYAKAISGQGDLDSVELPSEWADKHIVANVQKYVSGKFVLCEGNGYKEIADLK
jgi:hypothetical protein